MELEEPFLNDVDRKLRSLGFTQGTGDFRARWDERSRWNIPGPRQFAISAYPRLLYRVPSIFASPVCRRDRLGKHAKQKLF